MKFLKKDSKRFISAMGQLVNLCASKNMNLRPGVRAETNATDTIYLPWLDEDADDKKRLEFFCLAIHENSHIEGSSDVTKMSRKKVCHFFQNVVDDIRCERLQEKTYRGLKQYRRPFKKDLLEEFLAEEIATASKNDMNTFLHALGCLMIQRIRMPDCGMQRELEELKISSELQEAYDRYMKDLEDEVREIEDFSKVLEIGDTIYDRIKDLLRDEAEKQDPPKQSGDEDQDKDSSGGGSGEEDQDEGSSGGGSGEEDQDEGSSGDEEDSGEEDQDEGSSGGGSGENDQEEDDEDSGSKEGSSGGGSPEGEDKENKESSGSSSDDGSDEGSEDSGGGDREQEDVDDDDDNETDPEDSGEEDSSDDEKDSGEGNDQEEEDSGEEERKNRIRVKVQKELDQLDENMDTDTEMDKVRKQINQEAAGLDGPYMVHPDVEDLIRVANESDPLIAENYRTEGMKILGARGSKMTRLFVDQSRPKYLTHQKRGRFDMRSFISDPLDRKDDLYKDQIGAKLDKAAVSLVIDNSSSMSGKKIVTAYQISSALLKILSRANIPTEAVGFTGPRQPSPEYRTEPIILTIVKKFEEAYGRKILRRCTPSTYMGWTPDLDALRWAVPRLWARPEKKKILMILGDGLSEVGQPVLSIKLKRSYKKYIERCKKAGIFVFGFGIEQDMSSVLGEDCVTVNTSNMGDKIVRKLTELLNRKQPALKAA